MAKKLTQRLYVFLPARRDWPGGGRGVLGPASVVSWIAVGDDDSVREGHGAIANLPKSRRVELVFDSRDVFAATIPAPKLTEARLRQALPNLLEDRLLADPGDLHFAFQRSDAGLAVCAIDRTTMTRALEAFAQTGILLRAAYSAIYTVPLPTDGFIALRVPPERAPDDPAGNPAGNPDSLGRSIDPGSAGEPGNRSGTLRWEPDQGISLPIDDSGGATLALLQRRRPFTHLRVYGTVTESFRACVAELGFAIEECGSRVDARDVEEAVNLLQGGHAVGGSRTSRWARGVLRNGSWRAPAAWAAGCALIALVGLNATWLRLDAQARDLRQSIRHAFRDGFPQEKTVIDEVLQASRDVARLRDRAGIPSPDDFSALDAQGAQLLAEAPVGIVASIEYADHAYTIHFRPGTLSPSLRNALEARAGGQGLDLRFEPGEAVRIGPRGTLAGGGA